ncbi:MAG: KUP/HAK/KT family potassium transporter [Bacteroidales bacterium]|jgi:KUP system potassium uptake protein|nr:KUP/HAK/KT family potassium transporter [Bacteroidales bacterium]
MKIFGNSMDASSAVPYLKRFSLTGLVLTLGIVFGDLGTSPLYVMKAIAGRGKEFNELLIFGSLSCIFWTLTFQATLKYIIIILRHNNRGEGGIYALFALLKSRNSWIAVITMVGASALIADGIITPALSVTSAVEGFKTQGSDINVVAIVLLVIAALFIIRQYGAGIVSLFSGPVMVIWFLMIGVLGLFRITEYPDVLKALNPVYVIRFLSEYPGGFVLLGFVFLSVTGAEALYTEMGRCDIKNIRVTWIFVKISLLLNYSGQCAWLVMQGGMAEGTNPFFSIMPQWFLLPGIIIAIVAAMIASQTIISGAYTLVSEAISLNFLPKLKISNPSVNKGEVYVPAVNWLLWIACSVTVILFRESSDMEAAYGLSISLAMIMTTILLSLYLYQKGVNHRLVLILLMVFLTIEGSFLMANLSKLRSGGWFTVMIAACFVILLYGWYFGRKIKNKYVTFVNLKNYTDLFRDLSKDTTVPKTATNLCYIVKANRVDQVESKVIYSIFNKQPKRADRYWFIHVNRLDDPERFDYQVHYLIPGVLVKIDINIGFKVEPRINLYFREILKDLEDSGEIDLTSKYESLKKHDVKGDFMFILIDRIMTRDYKLSAWENFTLFLHNISRKLDIGDVRTLSLDPTCTIEEKVPITIEQREYKRIKRII